MSKMSTPQERRGSSRGGDPKPGGRSLGEINQRNLAERRHKKGECPSCGNKTHKIGLFGKRTPLTVEGLSLYGRCLLCNPVEGYARRPQNVVGVGAGVGVGTGVGLGAPVGPSRMMPPMHQPNVMTTHEPPAEPMIPSGLGHLPSNFVIDTEHRYRDIPDDGTMVSGITMDHRLIVGARNWTGDMDPEFDEDDSAGGGSWGAGGQGRPEPSVGGMDEIRPPQRRVPTMIRNDDTNSVHSGPHGPPANSRPFAQPTRYTSQHEAMMDQVGFDITAPLEARQRKSHRPAPATSVRAFDESFSAGSLLMGRPRAVSPSSHSRGGSSSRGGGTEDLRTSSHSGDIDTRFHQSLSDYHGEEKHEIESMSRTWEPPSTQYALNEISSSPLARHNNTRLHSSDDVLMQAESYGDAAFDRDFRHSRNPMERSQSAAAAPIPTLEIERARNATSLVMPRHGGSVWTSNKGHPPPGTRSRRGLPDDEFTDGLGRAGRPHANVRRGRDLSDAGAPKPSVSIDDISEIINSLDHTNRVRSFQSLAELIMSNGQNAKLIIAENHRIQVLVDSMWTDMTDPLVMEAACELLFALTASSDGMPESDVLVGDSAESAVDFLLITMQTHCDVESIQSSGCGTLHCLASASSSNSDVPDGTLSGAVFTVVNAMVNHQQSQEVQESGIRALYSQCMLSKHADSNRKNLAESGKEGSGGLDVIRCALSTARSALVTVELSCRLYWTLAANEDVARELMGTPGAFQSIMDVLDRYHKKPEAAPIMEAAYGALANLARVGEHQSLFRESEVIAKATQSIQAFHYNEGLYIEACALLGVLATDAGNTEKLVAFDVATVISKLLHQHDHNQALQEEVLLALVCLTNGSEVAKSCLSHDTIGSIVRLMIERNSTPVMKAMACTLIGSLCMLKESAQVAVTHGAIDTALALLKEFPNERKIHEAVFVTLRNITSQGSGVDVFLKFGTAKLILDAMSASSDSVTVQLNACGLLWNICAKSMRDPSSLVDAGSIMRIVEAMQIHMESGDVLELACGALWCLIDQSDSRKKELLGCGAIDAVTCAIVMHPNESPTVEKAFGLLANVCTSTHMAEAIADSQGISIVIEAMSGNANSTKLLELGALVIRNMVLTSHEFAKEASNGIPILIQCMKDNPDAVSFQREACNTLWALAAQSEECKHKILNLDGVSVLMGALEHNSCVSDVQDAARGAINQLALSGSGTS